MQIVLDPNSIDDYRTFINVMELPKYHIRGRVATFPDEYACRLGLQVSTDADTEYVPHPQMFDYQRDITTLAIRKRKYCVFADCGLGKTLIFLEFARHLTQHTNGRVLIVSPLMVVPQTMDECDRFYGGALGIDRLTGDTLQTWANGAYGESQIGIVNYDVITRLTATGNIVGLIMDESSMLKSHYGKWGTHILHIGRGLEWKMCCTGTPAPNDRIEYANHAVFMDAFPTQNAFLATFFVNRGQTDNRWELKSHALGPFYRALSHWSIFLYRPGTYGWKDQSDTIPPIIVHEHDVDLTEEQRDLAFTRHGMLFQTHLGGITSRSVLSQIAKGSYRGKAVRTNKPQFISQLVDQWPDESVLVWCRFNAEQAALEKAIPGAASIDGSTPHEKRYEIIRAFKAGRTRVLISKPRILGFGLNLQCATRHVFSACEDSYEEYYQAVKRSNRVGSTSPLNVHIVLTTLERPMAMNVLRKAAMVDEDTRVQEELFRNVWQ